jgi:homoserine dehydrogenase
MTTQSLSASTTLGFRSSGTSPTVHLIGAGQVGRAFLRVAAQAGLRVVAATDRTGTVASRNGIDALQVAAWKEGGRALREAPRAESLPPEVVIPLVGAGVVVDCAGDDPGLRRCRAALQAGARVVFAGKRALASAPDLLREQTGRIGFHAALGGTGLLLQRDRARLAAARAALLVANVSTTVILEQVERGASLAQGIAAAQQAGFLEPDPELDLCGADAFAKLSIVAGYLWGVAGGATVACEDLRSVDVGLVRERRARGATTRVVARGTPDGRLSVRCEEVERGSPLWAPPDRVVYCYELGGQRCVHVGGGVGPEGTARALLADVLAGGRR